MYMALVVFGDEQPPRTTEDVAVALARQPDSGCVHDGHHISYVVTQDSVEQLLIPVLKL